MRTVGSVLVAAIAGCLPWAVMAQETVVIDFDDLEAPCDLGSATALRDEYATLGIEFYDGSVGDDGGGAVVSDCGGLAVPGYSPSNFVVINWDAPLANGGLADGLSFVVTAGGQIERIHAQVGGSPGSVVTLECYPCVMCPGICGEYSEVEIGSGLRQIELVSSYNCCSIRVWPEHTDSHAVIDDLTIEFQRQVAPIPAVSPAGGVVLALLIGLIGGVLLSRGQG